MTSGPIQRKEHFDDPEWLVFAGQPTRIPGEVEDHAFDPFRGLFARKITDVQKDWKKITEQVQRLLEETSEVAASYSLDSVTLELGFTAEGQLCFVAKAGIETTVSMTFTRNVASRGDNSL